MTRFLAAAGFAGLLWAVLDGSAEASEAWPAEMAPELRRIQRELGGSVVEGFGEMGADVGDGVQAAKPPAAADLRRAAGGRSEREQRAAVEALREASEQLDMSANRLERFDLYEQADGLRAQAQRLRLEARRLSGGERQESRVEPAFPRPQLESVPLPSQPQSVPAEFEPTPLRE